MSMRLPGAGQRGVERILALVRPPPADLATEEGRAFERNRRAALTALAGIGSRFFSVGVSLITIPVLLNYLGIERYGIWLTISAGAAWLGLVQFGLAPSLINRLSALDRSDSVTRGRLVSTAWWLEIALGLVALVPPVIFYQLAPWDALFNVPPGPLAADARSVASVVWIGLAIGLPFSIPVAILRAQQEGYLANAWDLAGGVVRLVVLVAMVALDVGMAWLAIAIAVAGLAVNVAIAHTVFGRSPELRPRVSRVDGTIGVSLLRTGLGFTGIGIAALLISYTDLIVITQVLGPASVPSYAIAFSLLTLFVGLEMAVLDAAWPAYGESAARGDRPWVEATHARIIRLFFIASVSFAVLLIAFGQPVIRAWAGAEVVPPLSLLVVLGLLAVVQAYELPHGRMLDALGHVRTNTLLGLANAAINLPLSILLAREIGVTGVAMGTLVGYLVIGTILVERARTAMARVPRTGAALVSGIAGERSDSRASVIS